MYVLVYVWWEGRREGVEHISINKLIINNETI